MSNDDPKSQSVNPFAQGGRASLKSGQTPSQSFNPFAPKSNTPDSLLNSPLSSQSSNSGGQEKSVNPFAPQASLQPPNMAPPAATPPPDSPSSSFNPFASQQVGGTSPIQTAAQHIDEGSTTQSVNPFDQEGTSSASPDPTPVGNQSIAASRLGAQDSFNVFEKAPAAPNDFGSPDPFANAPSAAAPVQTEDSFGYSAAEAQQIRSLAPLDFAPAEAPLQDMSALPDIAAGFIKKKNVVVITMAAGITALLFGLLFGFTISERRAHNMRVDSWSRIDAKIAEPLQKVSELNKLIGEQLDSINKAQKIPWELNKKLPNKLATIPANLLVPAVPLENLALIELSDLVVGINDLFQSVRDHRVLTEAVRLDYQKSGQKTAFGSYPEGAYAIDISEFLARCSKNSRLKKCSHEEKPFAKVVAIPKRKKNQSRVKVVRRYERDTTKIKVAELIPVSRLSVLGRTNPTQEYLRRLIEIKGSIDKIEEARERFKATLTKKLSIAKVFTL